MTGDFAALAEELRSLPGASGVSVGEDGRTLRVRPAAGPADTRAAELGALLEVAGRYGVRVATTGDVPGGIRLCLDRWNRVLALDRENMCLVVQPEAAAAAVGERLAAEGLALAPDPCLAPVLSAGRETIAHYAATLRLLGVEAVLPDGRPVRLGGAAGGDQLQLGLARLILGGGGAFGVVTALYLGLVPLAPVAAILLAGFGRVDRARAVLFELAGTAQACRLECLDLSLAAPGRVLDHLAPFSGCGGLLVLEFAGTGPEAAEEAYVRAGNLCREAGALVVLAADNPGARQRARKVREHYLTSVGAGRFFHRLHGPVRPEWPDLAREAGLAVASCRVEGGSLALTLGGEGVEARLVSLLDGLRRSAGPAGAVGDVLARIGRVLDPQGLLSAADAPGRGAVR